MISCGIFFSVENGFPGALRTKKNVSVTTIKSTGIACSNRRKISAIIERTSLFQHRHPERREAKDSLSSQRTRPSAVEGPCPAGQMVSAAETTHSARGRHVASRHGNF